MSVYTCPLQLHSTAEAGSSKPQSTQTFLSKQMPYTGCVHSRITVAVYHGEIKVQRAARCLFGFSQMSVIQMEILTVHINVEAFIRLEMFSCRAANFFFTASSLHMASWQKTSRSEIVMTAHNSDAKDQLASSVKLIFKTNYAHCSSNHVLNGNTSSVGVYSHWERASAICTILLFCGLIY